MEHSDLVNTVKAHVLCFKQGPRQPAKESGTTHQGLQPVKDWQIDFVESLSLRGFLFCFVLLYLETSILSRVKQITNPGWMHETSAQGWCTGKTQRDGMGREAGGGNLDEQHM